MYDALQLDFLCWPSMDPYAAWEIKNESGHGIHWTEDGSELPLIDLTLASLLLCPVPALHFLDLKGKP